MKITRRLPEIEVNPVGKVTMYHKSIQYCAVSSFCQVNNNNNSITVCNLTDVT